MSVIAESGRWQSGKRRSLRTHRNVGLEVVCVTQGQATWHVEQRTYIVPPGSVFFTWPWERHGGINATEPGLEVWFVQVRLDREYVNQPRRFAWHRSLGISATEGKNLSETLLQAGTRAWPAGGRLRWLVRSLVDEQARPDAHHEAMARSLAVALLVELARSTKQPRTTSKRSPRSAEQRVERFAEQLGSTCHEPWTLETMASACGLGRTRFSALLRETSGDTPMMLLNRLRVRRAERMLTSGDAKVIEVAMACGFNTPQYFCRVFREYAGMTPSAYRKSKPA